MAQSQTLKILDEFSDLQRRLQEEYKDESEDYVLDIKKKDAVETHQPSEQSITAMTKTLDDQDLDTIVEYGLDIEKRNARYASKMLEQVEDSEVYNVNKSIHQLMEEIHNLTPSKLVKKSNNRVVQWFRDKTKAIKKELSLMNTISVRVDKIGRQLLDDAKMLKKDAGRMKDIYQQTQEDIHELDLLVDAGQSKIEEVKSKQIPHYKKLADDGDLDAAQKIQNAEDFIANLSQRLQDLESSRILKYTTLSEVAVMRRTNYSLAQQIEGNVHRAITQWKNEITSALLIYKAQNSIRAIHALNHATNEEMVTKNSRRISQLAKDTANLGEHRQAGAQIVKECLDTLNSSIEEAREIEQQRENDFKMFRLNNQKIVDEYVGNEHSTNINEGKG